MAEIRNVKFGDSQVSKIYVGENLSWIYETPDTTAPTTTIYPNPTYSYNAGQEFWLEVNEACNTYYTLDGTTPTTASTLFTEQFVLEETTTVKYFSVDLAGNVESVKTTTLTIVGGIPVTTISPTSTIQNTIPFTVSLSATNSPTAIYYRLGTGTQQTYTAPFPVNQSSAGVLSAYITVYYWSVNANGTEAEKSITYDTTGAIPSIATPTATNGENQVTLNWSATENTTSYSVYRSTTQGTTGSVLTPSQYQTGTTYTDTTASGGTTYYYTVRSHNYANFDDSAQVIGQPTAPTQTGYRYLKIDGYGEGANDTTRMIEVEAWVGGTNVLLNKVPLSYDTTIDTGSLDIGTINDGDKSGASGSYPIWWTPPPNANIVFDFGSPQDFTKLNYYGYSMSWEQRVSQFMFLGSNNGTDWDILWDMSGHQALQPVLPNGYEKIL